MAINDAGGFAGGRCRYLQVDTAVDIAKESAEYHIWLEKSLLVLEQGVMEAARSLGNIVKYIQNDS